MFEKQYPHLYSRLILKNTLTEFFKTFENYFSTKYVGSSRDKTRMLAKFLEGDLLQVYEATGGRMINYKDMKNVLLMYYKPQKVGDRTFWWKKFMEASPNEDESFDVFGMRIAKRAEHAYPEDVRKCAIHLQS